MVKTILPVIVTLTITLGGGVLATFSGFIHFGKTDGIEQKSQTAEPIPKVPVVPNIYTTEVLVPGILVSINRESRQSLLLLDLAIVVHDANEDTINKQRSKVVNSVLKLLNQKEEAYFYNDDFINITQQELKQGLASVLGIKIEDVLITKAVYQ